ncbi:hypothetical protein BD414DRAFT_510932 [Trametes punicea]|nr:hypothetical protein BD414DRAFT_510932 [Trametes punicea]
MPPKQKKDTSEASHLPTLARIFLDLASRTGTENDPAPFCWPEFQETVADEIPPWSPAYTPDEVLISAKEHEAIQSLVRAYYAPLTPVERRRVWNAAGNDVHRLGRTALNHWMAKKRAEWRLNSLIDETLEEAGVTLQSSACNDLTTLVTVFEAYKAQEHFCRTWFGFDRMNEDIELRQHCGTFFREILSLTWNRWRSKLWRDHRAITKAEREYNAIKKGVIMSVVEAKTAALEADGETDPSAKLTWEEAQRYIKAGHALMRRLGMWKEVQRKQQYAALEEETHAYKAIINKEVDDPRAQKLPRALRLALQTIPTAEEAEHMLLMIDEILDSSEWEDADGPTANVNDDWKEGTEIYADWTEDDIWNVFGLGQVRTVPGFAQKILLKGNFADPWSEEAQKALNGPGNNLLCLDGVGIGKTIQTVAAMGMYEWLRQVKTKEGRLPPRWANANARVGADVLVNAPHLVICPAPLLLQWELEIKRYLAPKRFAILPYTGNCTIESREAFWKIFDKRAKDTPTIILTTYPAIKSDLESAFQVPSGRVGSEYPNWPCRKTRLSNFTLFHMDRKYGIIAIDEIHLARKPGKAQVACTELRKMAHMTVGLTAMPIITDPRDLAYIGRILGFTQFNGNAMEEKRKEYFRAKNKEARDLKALKARNARVIQGKEVKVARTSLQALYSWIDKQREALVDNIDVVLTLRPDEMEIQRRLAEELRQQNVRLNGKNLHTAQVAQSTPVANVLDIRSFYLGIRKALLYKKLGEVPPEVFPPRLDSVRYRDDPSTKIDALIALLKYHEGKSCAQPAKFVGNVLVPPEYDENWLRKDTSLDKILVYLSFPSSNSCEEGEVRGRRRNNVWLTRLAPQALEEAGIAYLENNSLMSAAARHQALHEFENGKVQVMLVSNVGTVGLNIAFANIVICVDL